MNPMLDAALQRDLVLASASPRRAQILEMLGFEFSLHPTRVEDEHAQRLEPTAHALERARLKAAAAGAERRRGVCIGADTIVVASGRVLEKPSSRAEALVMLQLLRNRWHTVLTGLALQRAETGRAVYAIASTEVLFNACDDAFLERYVHTGEPDDKAGAYAIQGFGALLVREIRGCFYNVMGFPVTLFVSLLQELRAAEVEGAG